MLENDGPEQVVEKWISANGPTNTIGFGGAGNNKPFYDSFKTEFRKFICGSVDYDTERKKILDEGIVIKTVLISTASSAIAVKLGVMASLLVPAVALMFHVVGKIGINAWCSISE